MLTSKERMLNLLLSQFSDRKIIKALLETIGEEFDFHNTLKNKSGQRYGQMLPLVNNLICVERLPILAES